ncbi:hypothetical protein [Lysobacter sp. CA196]|uniref:hypothetical protein n=1 Tax=Lysobacter sp. CA196 TaxID=3455606 RepID=UPI003F8D31A3
MRVLVLALTVLALSACQKPAGSADPTQTDSTQADSMPTAKSDTGPAPAASPANPLLPPERVLRSDAIGYDGFNGSDRAGTVSAKFGADSASVRQAWGGEMKDNRDQRPDATCHLLYPVRGAVTHQYGFLMAGDKLAGIDVYDAKAIAPGGGRIGMSIAEINQTYAGQTQQVANPNFEGSAFIEVAAPQARHSQLTFETDALGTVTHWRISERGTLDTSESCTR